MSTGKTNRTLGHNAERHYAEKFRELGFDKCITSRQGSRLHDDCKIDLIFLPFNVQVKAGVQKGVNPAAILHEMEELLIHHFPTNSPDLSYPKLVIHKKKAGSGNRRTEYDELVTMTFEDFKKLIKTNYDL